MFALSPLNKQRSLGKVQRKSITRFLTKLSLKVKRGKFVQLKPQQQEELPSGNVISDDSHGSIEASGSMSYKCAAKSSDSLAEVIVLDSTMEYDSDDSMSFIEEKKLNMDARLTTLSFDDTEVVNHFRSSSGVEGFSLHKALFPRVNSSNTSQEARSLIPSLSLDDMLQITSFLSLDLEDFRSSPHDDNARQCAAAVDEVPQYVSEEDVNRRKFYDMLETVVSTPSRPEIRGKYNDILDKVATTPPRPASTWCSPAPTSPHPAPQSSCDESDGVELPETAQLDSSEGQEDSMNGDQMRRSDSSDSIPSLSGGADAWDRTPTDYNIAAPTSRDDAADSAIAWGCLAALLGSPAPSFARKQKKRTPLNLWQDDASLGEGLQDICLPQNDDELGNEMRALNLKADDDYDSSIPLCEDLVPDVGDLYSFGFPTTLTRVTSKKDITDSTLAWGVLGAILGSPAPSSVSKKRATRKRENLWEVCEEDDMPPEIEGRDYNEDACDDLSAPIDLTELEADEQVNVLADQYVELQEGDRGKESAKSLLAWTAIGIFLGSPAPKSVCKKGRKETGEVAKNLWKDFESIGDNGLDTVPFISPDEEDDSLATECRIIAENWLGGQDQDCVPSLSRTPSLSGTSDEEDGYSL